MSEYVGHILYGSDHRGTSYIDHYENMPIQIYMENFTSNTENLQIKNPDIFRISA